MELIDVDGFSLGSNLSFGMDSGWPHTSSVDSETLLTASSFASFFTWSGSLGIAFVLQLAYIPRAET
jgi:hypothetical protein